MSVSLCMIARNEEVNIKNTLENIYKYVDEIILVDTGSTDKTIDIAMEYGASIIESSWKKDFSYHRNESISLATCDWILFLDCDEIIDTTELLNLKSFLDKNKNSTIKGCNLKIVNMINNIEIASFYALRIFRNNEGFKFKNPIHEQILSSIVDKYPTNSIADIPINIYHYGYSSDIRKIKDKRKRNLDILHSLNIKDSYCYWALGNEYLQDNDYTLALINYEKSYSMSDKAITGFYSNLILNYCTALINIRSYKKATEILSSNKEKLPKFRDILFLEFWISYTTNQYDDASVQLNNFINSLSDSSMYSEKNFENIYDLSAFKSKLDLNS